LVTGRKFVWFRCDARAGRYDKPICNGANATGDLSSLSGFSIMSPVSRRTTPGW